MCDCARPQNLDPVSVASKADIQPNNDKRKAPAANVSTGTTFHSAANASQETNLQKQEDMMQKQDE